jgi:hypothetical protein
MCLANAGAVALFVCRSNWIPLCGQTCLSASASECSSVSRVKDNIFSTSYDFPEPKKMIPWPWPQQTCAVL